MRKMREKTGLAMQTLQDAREGRNITMETLRLIAEALKCKVRDLVEDE